MFTSMDLILLIPDSTGSKDFSSKWGNSKEQPVHQDGSGILRPIQNNANKDALKTEISRNHCQKIADTLNWDNISLIIVSPLENCLETCKNLLQASHKKIEVCVEPLITAKISKAQSVGKSKKELEMQYPEFCFDKLSECLGVPWYLSELCREKQRKMLALMGKANLFKNEAKETDFEFRMRLERFRQILKCHLEKKREGQRILIISHKQVFSMITAKFFTEQGKGCSDLDFSCAQLNFVSSNQVFHPLLPSPSL